MNKKAIYSLIFAGGLAVGAAGTGLYVKNQDHVADRPVTNRNLTSLYNNMFDKDFFRQSDAPFDQMEKMRKDMDKFFESSMKDFSKVTFDDWYGSKFGGSIGDIKQQEDAKYVYYKIDLKGIDRNSIKTEVNGGQVIISATGSDIQAQDERDQHSRVENYRSFQRSFPVPAGVDPNKVKFETKGDELLIKFPKMNIEDQPTV